MSNVVIKAENVSKIYRLGEIGTGTISRDIERWVRMNVFNQDDPFLKIGQTNYRSKKGKSDIVYSLRDVNFEINKGEAVGIVGRNGAGKSTLLKLLSRVTTPSKGRIQIKGRIASLLEVGTGFHPDLTGRENIFLNGAILGMRQKEINEKLDEIIDFSGIEQYIDTPVKRYSSGMYVRLAFAVAAHLEPEILIVDEVLAVGDAEFQKKCLGKLDEVSRGHGRTVLFVSHNVGSVLSLCNKAILMEDGTLSYCGSPNEVISRYNNNKDEQLNFEEYSSSEPISIVKIENVRHNVEIIYEEKCDISFKVHLRSTIRSKVTIDIILKNESQTIGYFSFGLIKGIEVDVFPGVKVYDIVFRVPNLKKGNYYLDIVLMEPNVRKWQELPNVIQLNVFTMFSKTTSWEYDVSTVDGMFLLEADLRQSTPDIKD